jgi:hypothetical protein
MTEIADNQKYRVNLICQCQDDAAFGYGATPDAARRNAEGFFREHHGAKGQYRQIVVEHAVAHTDGSHYEVFAAGMRYEFTRGLGAALYPLERFGNDLFKRDHASRPYVFETHSYQCAKSLRETLQHIADDKRKNQKMRDAAKRAHDEITKISRAVW